MAVCNEVSRLAAQILSNDPAFHDVGKFKKWVALLWKICAHRDLEMRSGLKKAWRHRSGPAGAANAIFRRMRREFPFGKMDNGVDVGLDAFVGLFRILDFDQLTIAQRQRLAYTLFNRNWLPDVDDQVRLLRLIRETFDSLTNSTVSGADHSTGLRSLLISITGPNTLDGVWFQLEVMKRKGFSKIGLVEGGDVAGRGLDMALKPPDNPRFYELKNLKNYIITDRRFNQILAQLTSPEVDGVTGGWKMYRVGFNSKKLDLARAGVNSVEEYIQWNGGRFLHQILRRGVDGGIPQKIHTGVRRNLKRHLESINPNINFNEFLDKVGVRNWRFRQPPAHLNAQEKRMFNAAQKFMGDSIMEDIPVDGVAVSRTVPGFGNSPSNFTI